MEFIGVIQAANDEIEIREELIWDPDYGSHHFGQHFFRVYSKWINNVDGV